MPNWCYNFATVVCPSRDVYNKLLKSILENNWFETFAPLGLENEPENNWDYNKAIVIWKTKWDANDVEILNQYEDDLVLEVSFETAWSPPTGVYDIMNKTFGIDTTAFYSEEGCDFFGKCIYSKEIETDETYEFPSNKKELQELREVIDAELDDFMSSTWEELVERWDEEGDDDDEDEDEDDEDEDEDKDDEDDEDEDDEDEDEDDEDDEDDKEDDKEDDNDKEDGNEEVNLPEKNEIESWAW
jgi:hypothetical protein